MNVCYHVWHQKKPTKNIDNAPPASSTAAEQRRDRLTHFKSFSVTQIANSTGARRHHAMTVSEPPPSSRSECPTKISILKTRCSGVEVV